MSQKQAKRARERRRKARAAPTVINHISTTQFYLLKWIACITMLIDHIAVFFYHQCSIPDDTYLTLRYIGRIAYPLFAYLLVESFHHTQNKKKHLLKIGILAVISELPYDIIFMTTNGIFDNSHQNVCVSLFLSFLCLCITNKRFNNIRNLYRKESTGIAVERCAKVCVVGAFAWLGAFLKVDLGFSGIILVMLLEFARNKKHKRLFQFFGFLLYGIAQAHIAYILIAIPLALIYCAETQYKKNGERDSIAGKLLCSKPSRKLSGIFYPLHLAILIIIRAAMVW